MFIAHWNVKRTVTRRAFRYRFEVRVEGPGRPIVENLSVASEALATARRFAGLMPVYVRDRSKRRGYLSEAELEALAALEVGGDAEHA